MNKFWDGIKVGLFTPDYTMFFAWYLITVVALSRDYGMLVWLSAIPAIALDIIMQKKVKDKEKENEASK